MIEVLHYSNEAFEAQFVPAVEEAYAEVTLLLDRVPKSIGMNFVDNGASEDTGIGGFAKSSEEINLAVLEGFEDRGSQEKDLQGVVFHEAFHIEQGFIFENAPFTALEATIYEGCAVAFERQYGKRPAAYADYTQHSEEDLIKWLAEIRQVGTLYFEDTETWHKWAFYHPEYDVKNIVYKVGSWLVDTILAQQKLGILDLKDKSTEEIEVMIKA